MSDPSPSSHWGAPTPAPTPALAAARHRAHSRLRAAYALLAVAGVLMLSGAGVLAVRGADRPGSSDPDGLAIRNVPSPSPAMSARPSAGQARVAPPNAPYSYEIPDGFAPAPVPKSSVSGQTGTHETALTPKGAAVGNIIAVSVYELGTNSDPYTYDQLQAEIDKLAQRVTPDPGEAQRLQVAGKRSLKYVFDFGSATVINYFIFSGATELQVRCQWTTQEATIERGCADLVNTLQIS